MSAYFVDVPALEDVITESGSRRRPHMGRMVCQLGRRVGGESPGCLRSERKVDKTSFFPAATKASRQSRHVTMLCGNCSAADSATTLSTQSRKKKSRAFVLPADIADVNFAFVPSTISLGRLFIRSGCRFSPRNRTGCPKFCRSY